MKLKGYVGKPLFFIFLLFFLFFFFVTTLNLSSCLAPSPGIISATPSFGLAQVLLGLLIEELIQLGCGQMQQEWEREGWEPSGLGWLLQHCCQTSSQKLGLRLALPSLQKILLVDLLPGNLIQASRPEP